MLRRSFHSHPRVTAEESARTPPAYWSALLSPITAQIFDELSVSVSLWVAGDWWEPISVVPNVSAFEREHGVISRRWRYNAQSFARVRRTGRALLGEHAGFYDWFVPLRRGDELVGIVTAGPFARTRPSSAELLERWYGLTGSTGRVSDPDFTRYVAASLNTLTVAGPLFEVFESLVKLFVAIVSERVSAREAARRTWDLRAKLSEARTAEGMWAAVHSMLAAQAPNVWESPERWRERADLGLLDLPRHAVVGLIVPTRRDVDALDDLLARDALQRAAVELARRHGHAVCGRVGDHGIAFLLDHTGSKARTRARLGELATRAIALGRRFGFRLHAGIQPGDAGATPSSVYRAALLAAEHALSRGRSVEYAEPKPRALRSEVRALRARFVESLSRPAELLPRFDEYAEAVLLRSGFRLEPVHAELDAAVERLVEPLLATGALDVQGFDELCARTDQAADQARNATELVGWYRALLSDIRTAIERPTASRQERSTHRALAFMHEHAAEDLTLAQVAHAGGFAPDYFSRLLRRTLGMPFTQHLQQLRVENAKRMLRGTELGIDGISRLCGFRNRAYFHRVFKKCSDETPVEYRNRYFGRAAG